MHWQGWKGTDIALGASPPPSLHSAHKYNHPRPPPWPSTSSIYHITNTIPTPISSLFTTNLNFDVIIKSCRVCPNRWFKIPLLAIGKDCNVLKKHFKYTMFLPRAPFCPLTKKITFTSSIARSNLQLYVKRPLRICTFFVQQKLPNCYRAASLTKFNFHLVDHTKAICNRNVWKWASA